MRVTVLLGCRRLLIDEVELPLASDRWFDALAYLAYRRKYAASGDGFVELADVRRLAAWDDNQLASIGKQFRRTLKQLAARGIDGVIESRDGLTKGPFRVACLPTDIAFDKSRDLAAESLGLLNAELGAAECVERHCDFANALSWGDVSFANGELTASLDAYLDADRTAVGVEHRTLSLDRIARVQRRLGRRDDAARTLVHFGDLIRSARYDTLAARATLVANEGWLAFAAGDLAAAEYGARKGLDLLRGASHSPIPLGRLHTLLGEVCERRGDYDEAAHRYAIALSLWTAGEWRWGIQAAYFNIGQLERVRGDALSSAAIRRPNAARPPSGARELYELAERWMRRVVVYCHRTGVGNDSCLDRIELARLAVRLGKIDEANAHLAEADRRAARSGSAPDADAARRVRAAVQRFATDGDWAALLRER